MTTTLFAAVAGQKPPRPCGLARLAAALMPAAALMLVPEIKIESVAAAAAPASDRADAATTAPASPRTPPPGRFEPAFEGGGVEIADAARPARPEEKTGPAASNPGFLAGLGLLAARGGPAEPEPKPAPPAAPADVGGSLELPAWITDGHVTLTGWLVGRDHAATVAEGCPPICVDPCDCPTWIGQIDALLLWMGPIPGRPLYLDSATGGATAIDANQLQPGVSAAPRYAVIYNRDQCRSIEVNYFSVWGFQGRRQAIGIEGTGALNGTLEMNDLAGLNFEQIGAAQATSSGHIQSLEINLRKVEWEWIRWVTGFRWVEWGQGLDLADAQFTDAPSVEEPTALDFLSVNTLNNLYGWQWGADAMLWNNGGRLRVNGIGKAGVYYNHQALQRTSYTSVIFPDPPTTTSVAADKDTVSFVGEAGVTGSWAITNWLSWRAGYTLFWIEGIATPANQLSNTVVDPAVTPSASISPYGGVLLHGVNTGLEARW